MIDVTTSNFSMNNEEKEIYFYFWWNRKHEYKSWKITKLPFKQYFSFFCHLLLCCLSILITYNLLSSFELNLRKKSFFFQPKIDTHCRSLCISKSRWISIVSEIIRKVLSRLRLPWGFHSWKFYSFFNNHIHSYIEWIVFVLTIIIIIISFSLNVFFIFIE